MESDSSYLINTPMRRKVVYRKLVKLFLEFMPAICVLMIVACVFTWGVTEIPDFAPAHHTVFYRIAGVLISFTWYAFAHIASLFMGFCKLHRAMIGYAYFSALLLNIDRWTNLDAIEPYVVWAIFVVGVIILALVLHLMIINRICKLT